MTKVLSLAAILIGFATITQADDRPARAGNATGVIVAADSQNASEPLRPRAGGPASSLPTAGAACGRRYCPSAASLDVVAGLEPLAN